MIRVCKTCREEKDLAQFPAHPYCIAGHLWHCRACVSEKAKAAYQTNKQRAIERAKSWALANPEKVRAIKKKSAEKLLISRRSIRTLQARIRRAANLPKFRLYGIIAAARRRAREAAAKGKISRFSYAAILRSANGFCQYCGLPSKALALDHIVPLSKGGRNSSNNLMPCCKSCNSKKGVRELSDWLDREYGVLGLARAVWFMENRKSLPENSS